jgi:hypothetical protein
MMVLTDASRRRPILELARGKYAGFNDSHLCEKLNPVEKLVVSRETVRRTLSRPSTHSQSLSRVGTLSDSLSPSL